MNDETKNKINEIFITLLDLEQSAAQDLESLSTENYPKWDSIITVNLIIALESELGIEIDADDYEDMNSYLSVIETINKYLK